jgi:hypothetical protein
MYIYKIKEILQNPNASGHITLSATCSYTLSTIDDISYVSKSLIKNISVSPTELERFYPEWQNRHQLLIALGYEKTELAEQLFVKPQQSKLLALNNVTFD